MTIYEHHRLLRTQDIDNFEAIVYINEPVELSQANACTEKETASRQMSLITKNLRE